ncbi:hypothetical protein LRP67_00180 [Nocardioides sp. cx-169]|uniref:hypothetical protein n=1 Tax=Nocardioides sp. cx-169 TaxID=2899080 RepID=UPI001E398B8A|nr:hypothetical protein [Nocardioides sp. cx-169]MCD4532508.1 hypothetical protein [Nocardioides sp. cx-169]
MEIITVAYGDAALLVAPAGVQDPGGPLWVEVRPALRRLHVVAGDVLAALGVRRDIAGKGRHEHDDIIHAQAWLAAHRTVDLVVVHAERLLPQTLGQLCDLADGAGLERLWLLHGPPPSDANAHGLTRRATLVGTLIDVPFPVPAVVAAEPRGRELPQAPAVEFTTFWAACRAALHEEDLERTRSRLAGVFATSDHAFDERGATQDTVADLVFNILNHAPTDNELTVDVRGLQLAAWHRDLYVKVDHTQLHQHEERPRLRQAQVDAAMLAYRQPYRTLTAALTRAGFGVADIASIAIAHCDPGGESLRHHRRVVHLTPAAATALRAQLHLRRAKEADEHDPLMPHTPKALAKALTDARVDLGIHVHGRRVERTRDHTARALRQLGITVHELR